VEQLLICTITPGQFSDEFAVTGRQSNGTLFSLFAPEDSVRCDQRPVEGQSGAAELRVTLCRQAGELAVVRLPQQSLEGGYFVTVAVSLLKPSPSARVGTRPG
jgi:hypothetical protein